MGSGRTGHSDRGPGILPVSTGARLNFYSGNVNGLNEKEKQILFFEMLEQEKADIAFISESHLLKEDIEGPVFVDRLKNTQYRVLSSSSAQDRTKGVMIIARRNLGANILGKGGDSDGRITYVKTEIENHKIAFMAI